MNNYLIIGASSGIGKQLAENLAQNSHKVFGTYKSNKPEAQHENLEYHQVNVLDEQINLDFLPENLNGIAYCPGSINLKPFTQFKPEEFLEDYNLQLVGAVKMLQAVLPKLKAAEHASIVLFSTVAVQTGFNFHTQVSSSKGAIEGFTRALAAELAPQIRVNCIAPSLSDTPLAEALLNTESKKEANAQRHPLKRLGTADDIAAMAEFLLTDKSGWISGQVIHIDGGMSALRT